MRLAPTQFRFLLLNGTLDFGEPLVFVEELALAATLGELGEFFGELGGGGSLDQRGNLALPLASLRAGLQGAGWRDVQDFRATQHRGVVHDRDSHGSRAFARPAMPTAMLGKPRKMHLSSVTRGRFFVIANATNSQS